MILSNVFLKTYLAEMSFENTSQKCNGLLICLNYMLFALWEESYTNMRRVYKFHRPIPDLIGFKSRSFCVFKMVFEKQAFNINKVKRSGSHNLLVILKVLAHNKSHLWQELPCTPITNDFPANLGDTMGGFSVLSLWQESGLWINKPNLQPLKLDHCSCSSLSNSTSGSSSRPCLSVNINCPHHLQWLFALIFPLKPHCAADPPLCILCSLQVSIIFTFWSITQARQIHLIATGDCGALGRKLEIFCHTAEGRHEIQSECIYSENNEITDSPMCTGGEFWFTLT